MKTSMFLILNYLLFCNSVAIQHRTKYFVVIVLKYDIMKSHKRFEYFLED